MQARKKSLTEHAPAKKIPLPHKTTWECHKEFTHIFKGKAILSSQAMKSAGSQGQNHHLDKPHESHL